MKIFISGGCKNGKSFYAQELVSRLGSDGNKLYVATMTPCDDEDLHRIKRHVADRAGLGFATIEQPVDIVQCADKCDADSSVLLDSTTALLSNEMFLPDGTVNEDAHKKIIPQLIELCRSVKNIVLVSDYIYSDACIYDRLTERYRFALAAIDKALAAECDVVCEVAFWNKIMHKGGHLL